MLDDQVVALSSVQLSPTTQSFSSPYTVILLLVKVLSPLVPALIPLVVQVYLVSLPLFMQLYVPPTAYVVMQSIHNIAPIPWMFGVSMFQFSKNWKSKVVGEYQYYLNSIDTYTLWEISGQALSLVLLCILAKYLILLFLRLKGR